jgi:hypothetical protein
MGVNYTSMKFGVWAVIDGQEIDLVQFSVSYELNAIPTCTGMLPVGYRVIPPYDPSPAHQITTGIQLQIPMQVYCEIGDIEGTSTPSVPAQGIYTLFDGYVTGVGYRRTYDGYSMTVEGTHWLSDLSYSSILSKTSSPANPTQFSFNASMNLGAGGLNAGEDVEHGLVSTMLFDDATESNINEDLWGKTIQPWLEDLASTDRIADDLMTALGGNADNDTEDNAVATALGKFDGEPLPFKTEEFSTGGDTAASMIARDLACTLQPTANITDGLAHQTFWDKIVGQYVPTYMFSVVPYPTYAKVVPFIPGLRDNWDPNGDGVTFPARDIEVQDMSCALPRSLRAVGIFGGYGSRAGAYMPGEDDVIAADTLNIGGFYMAEDVKTGMVLMREAPSFLWDAAVAYQFTDQVTKIRGNAFAHPNAGDDPNNGTNKMPANIKKDVAAMLDQVAHATYVNEILKNRWGDISTTLRFDVAPGSSVSLEGTSGAFGESGETRYAQVLRVAHSFDAQQQQCRSQFKLGYMHTEAEHEQDQFTTDAHPFYTTTWTGDKHITQN